MTSTIDFGTPEIVKRFYGFHERNPRVYDAIKKKAKKIINKKPNRVISFSLIYETARYELFVQNDEEEVFKMSNDFRAGYLRLLLNEFPMYQPLIKTRDSIFDEYITIQKATIV